MAITQENINDNSNITANSKQLSILKENFPNCFDKEGNFIVSKLEEIVKGEGLELSKESYSLNWLGKSYARLLANENPLTMLKEDKEHNNKEENKNSQNILIKGDNLEVLKHLKNGYENQVKMIYIDPPYNTGNDGFVYNDDRKFTINELSQLAGISEDEAKRVLEFTKSSSNSHSAWLTFIYPRLYIARELLKEDGVIFISIDDNEVSQLKLLCDEIFGEENFIADLIWRKKTGASDAKGFSVITENIMVFCKNNNMLNETFSKDVDSHDVNRYKLSDEYEHRRGKHYIDNLDRGGISYSDSLNYSIVCPNGEITYPNGRTEFENDGWTWTWGKDKLEWGINNGFIEFRKSKSKKSGWAVCYKNYLYVNNKDELTQRSAPHKNLILDILNTSATLEINKLFDFKVFKYPKPTQLLEQLINYIVINNNEIILDFFAGSGTTAHAVMELNTQNNGNRKFILVQIAEKIDSKKNKNTYDFVKNELKCEPTIFEITKERIIRASQRIRDKISSDVTKNINDFDLGFKIYETTPLLENKLDTMDKLEESEPTLFDPSVLTQDNFNALLTTWKVYDGMKLTDELQEIIFKDYKAYYGDKKLYFMYTGFTTEDLKEFIKKLDEDVSFEPNQLIVYGYNFESKYQREIDEALSSYSNKKSIEIDMIVRY